MILTPIKLPRIVPSQSLETIILRALKNRNLSLVDGDVVAVASKIVSICEGRIVKLSHVRSSVAAKRLARRWEMDERLTEIVLDEAERILGGVKGFMLTIKNGILTANAGVDLKNSPPGTAILWPSNPDKSANELRRSLEEHHGAHIGVEVVDSRVTPLRLGTVGLALGTSGFLPVKDERRKRDLYGRKVKVTQTNIADDLAASAHLLMGETNERIGLVIFKNAPVDINAKYDSKGAKLSLFRCLISSNIA